MKTPKKQSKQVPIKSGIRAGNEMAMSAIGN